MKKQLLIVMAIFMATVVFGQLTGTKTIPGDYATIALAVADLNVQGVGAGGVTFNIAAGYTETIASPISVTATGTAANPVVFQKSGAGANPLITAYAGTNLPNSAIQDGIWNLVGSDYVTIDRIDLVDPNSTNPATMEYGYALFKKGVTDGCQYNTIKNCTVTLSRVNNASANSPAFDGSRGINVMNALVATQTTAVTPTSAAGTNSYNMFYSNTLQNCNIGIALMGYAAATPFTLGDTGNDIGGSSSATGNTILNFGGATGATNPAAGIRANNQWGINISYNTVNNNNGSGVNHPNTLRGIYAQGGTSANATIRFNAVSIYGGGTTNSVYGIDNAIGTTAASNTVDITNNTITGGYSTATTGVFYGIQNTASPANLNIQDNTVTTISTPGTGSLYGMAAGSPTNLSVTGNTITNLTKTGIGAIYGINMGTAVIICRSNLIDGLSCTAASSTASVFGIQDGASALTESYSFNIIKNLSSTGTASLYGIFINTATGNKTLNGNEIFNLTVAGGGTLYGINLNFGSTDVISDNLIHDFNITGSASGTQYGIRINAGTTNSLFNNSVYGFNIAGGTGGATHGIYIGAGTTNHIYKNRIYNLASGSTNPLVYGINLTAGTTNNIYNNFVSDLRTGAANAGIPLAGIYAGGGTTNNVFYNTVYLSATSAGALFGSAALYASTSTTLDSRNNILVNVSTPNGTGVTAAYRRSGTTLTTYSANSNANDYYAGAVEDATHAIFYDGTTAYNMAAFQTLVGPVRDAVSFRHLPPFMNIAATPYDLHLQAGASTSCESGGLQVTTPVAITDDNDGNIRQGNPGYSGTGTAPDVGADEFNGTANYTCSTPNPGATLSTANNLCLGQSVTLSFQNATSGTGITYQWQNSSDNITFSNIAGANAATYTFVPAAQLYYQCVVTCMNGPVSVASTPLLISFNNSVLTTTPGTRCGTGTVQLGATVSGGTLKWYTAETGGTAIGTGSPFVTPSISATTSFYAAADIPSGGITLGAGASTSSGYESPFYHLFGGKKSQYLIKASELTTAGLTAGNISTLAFEIVVAGTTYNSFNLSIGNTALSALTTTLQTGLTPVYTAASITPVAGIYTITLSTPFAWDGTSNIIVETCWSNTNGGGSSATVKYDATSFVSESYYRADNIAPATLCAATTATSTMSARPKMYFNYSAACPGPRKPVVATVTPAPLLTITGDQTVCNNTVATMTVTSNVPDYDSYVWSPVTNLFTDPACTVAYVAGSSSSTVYVLSASAAVTTYSCTATNALLCSGLVQSTVTTLPGTITATGTPSALCLSGTAVISVSPATGYGTATFLWQNSADNVNFSDIAGATGLSYTTPTLTSTTYYRLQVISGGTSCAYSSVATITVNNPLVATTAPASRCGTGTVTLGATATGGTINWYNASTGGTLLGTGDSYTTPAISSTTSYYAEAVASGSVSYSVGKPNTNGADGNMTSGGLVFDAYVPFTLSSVNVYPVGSGAGTVTIQLQNSSGTVLQTTTVALTGTTAPGIKTLVPLNFSVPAGTGLKLMFTAYTGSITGMTRDYTLATPATVYPYTVPGVVSITGATLASYYYFFYDWSLSVGCRSARTEVIATVTVPPALSLSANQTVCNNHAAKIRVTSTPGSFNNYVWTPATDLFLDAAGTIPYVAGTSADSVYLKTTVPGDHTITCSALNTADMCSNTASTIVTVTPLNPTITAAPGSVCVSGFSTLTVSPSTGYGTSVFQWQASTDNLNFEDIPGATAVSYVTPVVSAESYYRLLIRDLNNNICSQPQFTLVVNNPQVTGTTPGSHCGTGSVTLGATGTGGTITWYSGATGNTILGTGSPFNTPSISSTTSYYVASVASASGTASVGTGATTSSTYPNPFYSNWSNTHNQYLVKASELLAAAIPAGNLTSLAINITSGTTALKEFSVKMGLTTATVMSAFLSPTFTTVYSAASLTPVAGVNTFAFSAPFNWDGVSNIVIEICHGNSASTTTISSTCSADNTSYVSVIHAHKTVASAGSVVCGDNTSNLTTYSVRPKFIFGYLGCESARSEVVATITAAPSITATATPSSVCALQQSLLEVTSSDPNYTYTWTPGNLTGATQTVYPESTTTYTVSASNAGTGCTAQTTTSVNVLITPSPLVITPAAPVIAPGAIQQLAATGGEVTDVTLFSENFNGATNNWTTVNNSTGGTPAAAAWTLEPDGYSYSAVAYHSNDNTQFYMTNGDAQGSSGVNHTQLISPVINTTGYTSLSLSFWHYFKYVDADSQAKIDVSTDGGTTWNATPVASYTSTQGAAAAFVKATVDMTAWINQSNLKFRFRFQDTFGWYWCIDNVAITGTAAAAITWSPVTDLYSDAGATVAYAGEPLGTVYTKPLAGITYTATSVATVTGCQRTKTVTVTLQEPCGVPASVSTSAIASTSATLSWTAPSTPPGSGYEYEIRTSGAAGSGASGLVQSGTVPAGTTSAGITGLTPYTQYHAYVRSNCGDNSYSEWTTDHPFTTLPEPLSMYAETTPINCYGGSDGSLGSYVSGGVLPYSYLWSTGATTSWITGLAAGTYSLTVTDAVSATISDSWTLTAPAQLSVSGNVTNATCPTAGDGSITLTVTGGTPDYTYLWNNGSTNKDLSGLAPGSYAVTVTDSHGCTSTASFTVGVTSAVCPNINVTGNITTTVCYDATSTITVAGGTTVFEVSGNGSATFIAGEKISYLPGTKVTAPGKMYGKIAPSGPFCTSSKITEVAAGAGEVPAVTERAAFTLYPNPTNGNFTLVQKGDRTWGDVKVEVYSMSGKKVMTETLIGDKHEFRFADMPGGLYFVKVVADNYVETIKLVKTK